MTPTEQLEQWIAKHGSARDALNVALSRLGACQALLTDAEAAVAALESLRMHRDAIVQALSAARFRANVALNLEETQRYADAHEAAVFALADMEAADASR